MGSDLEEALLRQIEDAGLPPPAQQHRFAKGMGRQWRFDLMWTSPGWYAVEIDGGNWSRTGAHGSGQGSENDAVKGAVATLLGWEVYRVNGHMIEDGRALMLIRSWFDGSHDAAAKILCEQKCMKCDLTRRRRNQKQRQKAKESNERGG
jgi:hypothetical protein